MLDEYFFDYKGTIMAYDDFEYIERNEKISAMMDLITFSDEDDKILQVLCDLLPENADYFLEAHNISREGNAFLVDEDYIEEMIYEWKN